MVYDYVSLLGDIVKSARKKLGITQFELASRIDVDVRTILNIENARGNPKFEVLVPLIHELKIDANDIFYPQTLMNTENSQELLRITHDCSEFEIESLCQICETVLSVIRSDKAIKILDK